MTTILGPNGSGKSTLFKCIAGLWKPQKGEILFGNKDISRISHVERAKIFAVVPQEHEPPFPYSVLDVVLMGRASHVGLFSSPSKHDYLKAEESVEIVGIDHLKDRPYTKISGGEKQLVLIARALSQESPILLLDEPTSHLDLRNQVITMLFSEKGLMLNDGHVVSNGSPQEVITEDNLKSIYKIDVSVINWNGTKIIYPRIDP